MSFEDFGSDASDLGASSVGFADNVGDGIVEVNTDTLPESFGNVNADLSAEVGSPVATEVAPPRRERKKAAKKVVAVAEKAAKVTVKKPSTKAKKALKAVVNKEPKKKGRGRPVLYKGDLSKAIVRLLRANRNNACAVERILKAKGKGAKNAALIAERTAAGLTEPHNTSKPTIYKIATAAGIVFDKGRPVPVAEKTKKAA